jgi:hypothetical protein
MSWPKTADGQYYIFDGQVLMPVDPSNGVATLLLRPTGGMGVGIPAIEQGDPGAHAEIDNTINYTVLAATDTTPSSASFTTITPPTTSTPGVYRLNLAIHEGEDGAPGDTVLDPTDYGTPVWKNLLQVDAGLTGFEFVSPKVGDRFLPALINNTAAGNANNTLGIVTVPSQDFAWRPEVEAQTVVTGTGPDVRVDLVARLNGELGGNVIGRCTGLAATERLTLCSAPPAGSADAFDRIVAGASATIYLRCERVTGTDTYTTSATTTFLQVRVHPIP